MVCAWANADPLLRKYHDEVWGKPCHDDCLLFEYLVLESFQAGLSWLIVLKKQVAFEKAFDKFDIAKVAAYDKDKVAKLMNDQGIIRNRRKIENAITMAKVILALQKEFGSFDHYIWQFNHGQVLKRHVTCQEPFLDQNELSTRLSRDLYKRGCRFVGPVICYSYLQAIGMIDDHDFDCEYKMR